MGVVGIDLGTTNTVVASVREGRVQVLADEDGHSLLPSVVSFHPNGTVLVGHAAKARRMVDPRNTIASVKRLIGRPWDSDEIALARSRFAFELREGTDQGSLVVTRGETYTLPEISAFVLTRARQIAEAALGEVVDQAVITVPAHFNELQRASTKVAGRIAGLHVLRILNEPTAAALAYGLGKGDAERVAVYDFGGGTFDCSLLQLTGTLFEVLATAGDTFLGGDDIDNAIAETMCNAFLAQHRYDPRTDPQAFEKMRSAAEELKKDLSVNMQTVVDLPELAHGLGGKRLGLRFAMTQADLDALASSYVDRTLEVTRETIHLAQLSPSSFDQVVLVGGSTRMPLVKRRVEAYFGVPVMDRVNPDEVVAIGAAVQAAALVDATRQRSIPPPPRPGVIAALRELPSPSTSAPILIDVTPRALVVETAGGFCDTVIPRNAKIPCEHTQAFATGSDLQTHVHVRVAQGEEERFEHNSYLGELELSDLRPAPRGEVTLEVSFEIDADGSLQVTAVDAVSGREARAVMKLVNVVQSEEEIEEMASRSRSTSVTG
jgi:molecular chaperone DnaK